MQIIQEISIWDREISQIWCLTLISLKGGITCQSRKSWWRRNTRCNLRPRIEPICHLNEFHYLHLPLTSLVAERSRKNVTKLNKCRSQDWLELIFAHIQKYNNCYRETHQKTDDSNIYVNGEMNLMFLEGAITRKEKTQYTHIHSLWQTRHEF